MKNRLSITLFWLPIFLLLACVSVGAQPGLDAVRFPFDDALHVLQGAVMTGDVSPELTGPEFVTRGLAGHPQELRNLDGYYLTGYVANVRGHNRAVLLLCNRQDGIALLEGVLCRSRTRIITPSAVSSHQCVYSLDVRRECAP